MEGNIAHKGLVEHHLSFQKSTCEPSPILNMMPFQNIPPILFKSSQKVELFVVFLNFADHEPHLGPYLSRNRCIRVLLGLVISIHHHLDISAIFIICKSKSPNPLRSFGLQICPQDTRWYRVLSCDCPNHKILLHILSIFSRTHLERIVTDLGIHVLLTEQRSEVSAHLQ